MRTYSTLSHHTLSSTSTLPSHLCQGVPNWSLLFIFCTQIMYACTISSHIHPGTKCKKFTYSIFQYYFKFMWCVFCTYQTKHGATGKTHSLFLCLVSHSKFISCLIMQISKFNSSLLGCLGDESNIWTWHPQCVNNAWNMKTINTLV